MPQRAVLWPLCLSLLIGKVAAQTGLPQAESGPIVRTTSSEVLLDLVVVDRHGKPVRNLKPGDVSIYEDGVRQEMKSFRLAGARETRTQKSGAAVERAQTPAATRSLRAVNLVCIVFHNLNPELRKYSIDTVQEFLANEMPANTYIGIFVLDDRLTPVYPFTKDRNEVSRAAANAFNLRPMDFASVSESLLTANPTLVTIETIVSGRSAESRLRISGGEVSPTVITGADVSTSTGANLRRGQQVIERRDFSTISGMREEDKIINMVRQFGELPGRKSVLLISTGLLTSGDPDRLESILTKANQAGVTIYALDAAGLSHVSTSQAADLALGQVASVSRTQTAVVRPGDSLAAAKEKSRQGDTMNDAVRASDSQAALRAISEGTGGFLIANTNEYRKPFQRIVEDVDVHYEASYRPAADKFDGRFRKIEVKLARPDLHVESRVGYFAMPDLKTAGELTPAEVMALAALSSNPLPHAFDFKTAVYRFRNRGALVFELPGDTLSATPKAEAMSQILHGSLLSLVKDAGGQVVDKFSVDAPFEIPTANLKAVRANPLVYSHPVSLSAGRYSLESAVLDREGGRSSTSVLDFDGVEPSKGISMSSVVLIQRIEAAAQADASDPLVVNGKRLVPLLETNLPADAQPYVYFVVYPNRSNPEKPKLQVEFRVDGQVRANQTSDLPAANSAGEIPMLIRAATHPGNCELTVSAVQGGESIAQKISYTIGKQ